jgi:endonuclease-3
MDIRRVAIQLLKEVERIFPEAKTELKNWNTPFQFLICIVLSAQTTDRQVNIVTKELFRRYPDAFEMSRAKVSDIEKIVKSVNYFRVKSKHIKELSLILAKDFNGIPPKTTQELIILPGVGYKTANVFLNDLYKANQGIAVDTHVARVAKSYGLTKNTDPYKIAKDLERLYPKKDWYRVNSCFVLYGRYILKAKKPDMNRVVLKEYLIDRE